MKKNLLIRDRLSALRGRYPNVSVAELNRMEKREVKYYIMARQSGCLREYKQVMQKYLIMKPARVLNIALERNVRRRRHA